MARDVLSALTSILQTQGNMDEGQAASYIKKLQNENRFLQDVWSWSIRSQFIMHSTIFNDNILPTTKYFLYTTACKWTVQFQQCSQQCDTTRMWIVHCTLRKDPYCLAGIQVQMTTHSRLNCGYAFLQLGNRPLILALQYIICYIYGSPSEMLMGSVNYLLTFYVSGLEYFRVLH